MIYRLPQLPYEYDALEPYIDAQTMEIHHGKHHSGYVKKLNAALEKYGELQDKPLTELLTGLEGVPSEIRVAVRNNGGGHFNHSLFWKVMRKGGGGEPRGDLGKAIQSAFGAFSEFKAQFSQAALNLFGSGWAWLCFRDGELVIEFTPNQDNPLMKGAGEPILGLDVWEHAYYLRYQNRRTDYVGAWWNVVNWEQVGENLTEARKLAGVSGFASSRIAASSHSYRPESEVVSQEEQALPQIVFREHRGPRHFSLGTAPPPRLGA